MQGRLCHLDVEKKIGWACPVVLRPAQLPIAKERKNHPTALRYQRIQIPSADVMSWPAIVPLTKPGEEFLFDAGRITSYWNQDEKGMGAEQAKWLGAQCGEKEP